MEVVSSSAKVYAAFFCCAFNQLRTAAGIQSLPNWIGTRLPISAESLPRYFAGAGWGVAAGALGVEKFTFGT